MKHRQDPTKPDTTWFVEARFGLFIHWGLYALAARHEWVKSREQIPDGDYRCYFDRFDPDLFDPADWARRAKEAGMRYVVLTAKHHEGFCLWDSAFTDYKVTRTPAGRDLLKPFVQAFREAGLRIGFYYSLIDWHHPQYTLDRHHPDRNRSPAREQSKTRDIRVYAEYVRNQVRELLTDFAPLDIIWYDFSFPGEDGKGRDDWQSEKLVELTRELAPGILINNRLDLPGAADFVTPEQYQPRAQPRDETGQAQVWEACQTFSGSWGYHRDEAEWKGVGQILRMLIDGVSKNGNLLLNVGPTARGNFDPRACERLAGIGDWMKFNSRSIYGCGAPPEGWVPPPDCRYTWDPRRRRLYLHFFAWPFRQVHLPGLRDQVEYAQFLHDASEVRISRLPKPVTHTQEAATDDALVLQLPTRQPAQKVPVVELFLREAHSDGAA